MSCRYSRCVFFYYFLFPQTLDFKVLMDLDNFFGYQSLDLGFSKSERVVVLC